MLKSLQTWPVRVLTLCLLCWSLSGAACAQEGLHAAAASAGVQPQALQHASTMTGRSPSSLARLLTSDKQASLTDAGAVVFGCHLHEHDTPADRAGVLGFNPPIAAADRLAAEAAADAAAAKMNVSLAFKLHSRPSSTRKVFLEFRGCVTEVRPAAAKQSIINDPHMYWGMVLCPGGCASQHNR
jgi:hypothetical protein